MKVLITEFGLATIDVKRQYVVDVPDEADPTAWIQTNNIRSVADAADIGWIDLDGDEWDYQSVDSLDGELTVEDEGFDPDDFEEVQMTTVNLKG